MLPTVLNQQSNFTPPIKNVRTNKTFLARFGSNNNNNSNLNSNESPVVMKCLNELPRTKVINNKKVSLEVTPPLISKNQTASPSQSSEISIISHHSSTNSKDDELSAHKVFVPSNDDLCITEDNQEDPLGILTIYGNGQRNDEDVDLQPGLYYQETQLASDSLQQGLASNTTHHDVTTNDNGEQNGDIKISRYVQDKSKIRSQFMQRFAVPQKRQVIPQVIPNGENFVSDHQAVEQDEQMKTQAKNSSLSNTDTLTASLAASLAITVTQPFLKIQNDLENKMNNLLQKFEKYQSEDPKANKSYEAEKRKIEDDMKELTDSKLKYIEKLQENQFQLMTQLVGAMGKENYIAQNADQAQERLNYLLNEYKSELLNFKLKMNNLEPNPPTDNRYKTQVISKVPMEDNSKARNRPKSKASKSPAKKTTKKSANKSRSRSTSPVKMFEPEFGCMQCAMNECNKHRAGRRAEFLEQLLENASPEKRLHDVSYVSNKDEERFLRQVASESILKKATIDLNDNELLFDKYLSQGRTLDQKLQSSLKSQQIDEFKQQIAQTNRHQIKKSSVSDLEETLKEIERSRESFEQNMNALVKNRDNKFDHLVNTNTAKSKEDLEKIRVQIIVDGYLNVIASDVQKEVTQEMIDKSKHAKLEAERDSGPRARTRARIMASKAAAELPTGKRAPPKMTSQQTSEKYLRQIYGKDFMAKAQKGEIKAFEYSKELDPNRTPFGSSRQSDDIFDRIISNSVPIKPNPKVIEHRKQPITNIPNQKETQPKRPTSNVTVANVVSHEKKSALQKQILPCLNISSQNVLASDSRPADVKPSPRSPRNKYDDDFESGTDEDDGAGTGINYPGFKKPVEIDEEFKYPKPSPRNKDKELHYIQPSSDEIADRLKSRDLLENKALDWIEQELMARFVNTLVRHEEPQSVKDPIADATYIFDDDDEDEDESESSTDAHENILLNALGQQGFQLLVDAGQNLDPDLIQALVREVLEEKIATMVGNNRIFDEQQPEESLKEPVKPPQPTPRNIERNSNGHLHLNLNQVETPEPTPVNSPVQSPRIARRPTTPVLTPRSSIYAEEPRLPEVPQVVVPRVVEFDEETESLLETVSDHENDEVELVFDQRLVIIVKTPPETPRDSPSPPSTPTISQAPMPIRPALVTTSVQCDPEPVPPKPVIIPPAPQPVVQVIVPKRTRSPVKSSSSSSSSSSVSLTSSSTLSEEAQSSTTNDETYLSEGCWLRSRSEGQILNNENKALKNDNNLMSLVQLDMSESEGEIKGDNKSMPKKLIVNTQIPQSNKHNWQNINRMSSESGEIQLRSSVNGNGNNYTEKSDGEVMNNGNQANPKLNKFFSSGNSNGNGNGHQKPIVPSKEKTVVNLHVSKKAANKNNIQIEPIPHDQNLRDSKEFDRKIFSSTPDSSAVFTSSLKKFDVPSDMADYRIPNEHDDYLNARQSPKKQITINMMNNYNTNDDNQDTLSNFSDIEQD